VFDPSPQEGSPLPEEKILLLREALGTGGVEVALHGYAHQTRRTKLGGLVGLAGYHSEFAGADPEAQRRKLEQGRVLLESDLETTVTTFIPPWNNYDASTLKALEASGFRTLSADRRGPAPARSRLSYLPRTCDLDELRSALMQARSRKGEAVVVVTLFHAYDFTEADPEGGTFTLSRLGDLLDWVNSQDDVRVLTLDGAARALPDLGVRRFVANRNALFWKLVPSWPGRFLPWPSRGLYLAVAGARREKRILGVLAFAMVAGSLLLAGLAWRVARRIFRLLSRWRLVIYFRRLRRSRDSTRLSHGMD
ncbi:MAG TPA: DUF2334 domain-containing protein, partial [Candidatus Polarisedimenticolia bacterium]|nr:DUF2334 domain-containing protein [Candidatus Polarisedimenticolia bacterium]